jgi:hypothetical protein
LKPNPYFPQEDLFFVKKAGKPVEENPTIKFTLCGTGILPVHKNSIKEVKSN